MLRRSRCVLIFFYQLHQQVPPRHVIPGSCLRSPSTGGPPSCLFLHVSVVCVCVNSTFTLFIDRASLLIAIPSNIRCSLPIPYVRGPLDMKMSEGRLFTTELQQERKNKKHETKTGSRNSNHQCNVLITTKNSAVRTLFFTFFVGVGVRHQIFATFLHGQ